MALTHTRPQSTCSLNKFEYTHIHANKQPPWQYTLTSAVSFAVKLSYEVQPSLVLPGWLAGS